MLVTTIFYPCTHRLHEFELIHRLAGLLKTVYRGTVNDCLKNGVSNLEFVLEKLHLLICDLYQTTRKHVINVSLIADNIKRRTLEISGHVIDITIGAARTPVIDCREYHCLHRIGAKILSKKLDFTLYIRYILQFFVTKFAGNSLYQTYCVKCRFHNALLL